MKGEDFQLCGIVAAVKNALRGQQPFHYEKSDYVERILFKFEDGSIAGSVEEWYEKCSARGLTEIYFAKPGGLDERSLTGFANTNRGSILCYFGERASYFTATWQRGNGNWIVGYVEEPQQSVEKPYAEDNTEQFVASLAQIAQLAGEIGESYWKEIFERAAKVLDGEEIPGRRLPVLPLPEKNLRMLQAASAAYVFGGMGSWNDSPPYTADQHGKGEEYDRYSDELLRQICLAEMYAVNGW